MIGLNRKDLEQADAVFAQCCISWVDERVRAGTQEVTFGLDKAQFSAGYSLVMARRLIAVLLITVLLIVVLLIVVLLIAVLLIAVLLIAVLLVDVLLAAVVLIAVFVLRSIIPQFRIRIQIKRAFS